MHTPIIHRTRIPRAFLAFVVALLGVAAAAWAGVHLGSVGVAILAAAVIVGWVLDIRASRRGPDPRTLG